MYNKYKYKELKAKPEYLYFNWEVGYTRQVGFIIIEVVYYRKKYVFLKEKKLYTLRNCGNGWTGCSEELQVVRVTQESLYIAGSRLNSGGRSCSKLPGFRQLSFGQWSLKCGRSQVTAVVAPSFGLTASDRLPRPPRYNIYYYHILCNATYAHISFWLFLSM